ncbi:MAG: hypothetical protein K8R85_04420 [Bacteroidetes bacterium]|nr:hypothetical protein [Bacteroidota bacterium]
MKKFNQSDDMQFCELCNKRVMHLPDAMQEKNLSPEQTIQIHLNNEQHLPSEFESEIRNKKLLTRWFSQLTQNRSCN